MSRFTIGLIALLVVLFVLADASLFTVDQTEQVLVTQFGEIVRPIRDPGLKSKLPFVQSIITFDKRLLSVELPDEEVILGDQRRLIVDSFAVLPHHRSAEVLSGGGARAVRDPGPAEFHRHRQPAARAGQQPAARCAVGRPRADHGQYPRPGERRDAGVRRLDRGRAHPEGRPTAGEHAGDPAAHAVGAAARGGAGARRGSGGIAAHPRRRRTRSDGAAGGGSRHCRQSARRGRGGGYPDFRQGLYAGCQLLFGLAHFAGVSGHHSKSAHLAWCLPRTTIFCAIFSRHRRRRGAASCQPPHAGPYAANPPGNFRPCV